MPVFKKVFLFQSVLWTFLRLTYKVRSDRISLLGQFQFSSDPPPTLIKVCFVKVYVWKRILWESLTEREKNTVYFSYFSRELGSKVSIYDLRMVHSSTNTQIYYITHGDANVKILWPKFVSTSHPLPPSPSLPHPALQMRWAHFIRRIFWAPERAFEMCPLRTTLWKELLKWFESNLQQCIKFNERVFIVHFSWNECSVFCAIIVYFQYVRRKYCYCCDSKSVNSFLWGLKIGESGDGLFRFGSINRTYPKLYFLPSVNQKKMMKMGENEKNQTE